MASRDIDRSGMKSTTSEAISLGSRVSSKTEWRLGDVPASGEQRQLFMWMASTSSSRETGQSVSLVADRWHPKKAKRKREKGGRELFTNSSKPNF